MPTHTAKVLEAVKGSQESNISRRDGQSCVLTAASTRPRGAISIQQSGHMIYGNLRQLTLAKV
jgi:antitoxin (DNA-binding transcriptional repressor) of toxin-antitoxin stability system